mgnify:CR=1 FL=1
MNTEDYVSLEVAKLLKEKGYCWPCGSFYTLEGIIGFRSIDDNFNRLTAYSRPALYEAQKWLREIHNIDVLPVIREESTIKDYCCNVYKNAKVVRCKVAYGEDFYECMNEGLVEALNLI